MAIARKSSAGKGRKSSKKPAGKVRRKTKAAGASTGIQAWQDDPLGLPLGPRPVPNLNLAPLKFKIKGNSIPARVYPPGTPEFRYWTAAEAVRRGGDFWASLGIKRWQASVGAALPIGMDEGTDLNAYYNRSELAFFHDTIKGQKIFSAESPDVVCHELGHACLDAHRPQLWDAPYIEVGSFHESFGDMSAILSALQLPGVRKAALAGLKSGKPSVLSRCAEQLGWAIRQIQPHDVDPDCLRNASNKFKYVDPNTLPNAAPAKQLCAEVHSFSRVFTGAFYDILSGMLSAVATTPTEADLLTVAADCGNLLMDGTAAAPVTPNFFAQVAARMIDADTSRFHGKYRSVLTTTFVKRKILSAHMVAPAPKISKQAHLAAAAFGISSEIHSESHQVVLSASIVGLPEGRLIVEAPVESSVPLATGMAELRSTEARRDDVEVAAQRFVEVLVAHGRVAVEANRKQSMAATSERRKMPTHRLVKVSEGLQLKRQLFLCGCARVR